MPFSLIGGPSRFQRLMYELFINGWPCYLLPDKDADYLFHLHQFFGRLQTAHLVTKPARCYLSINEVEYLSHVVGGRKVRPQSIGSSGLRSRKMSGPFYMAGYYTRFIHDFAELILPTNGSYRERLA